MVETVVLEIVLSLEEAPQVESLVHQLRLVLGLLGQLEPMEPSLTTSVKVAEGELVVLVSTEEQEQHVSPQQVEAVVHTTLEILQSMGLETTQIMIRLVDP